VSKQEELLRTREQEERQKRKQLREEARDRRNKGGLEPRDIDELDQKHAREVREAERAKVIEEAKARWADLKVVLKFCRCLLEIDRRPQRECRTGRALGF